MSDTTTLKIFRGDKSGGEMVQYSIPSTSGMVVLDAVHSVPHKHAPVLKPLLGWEATHSDTNSTTY